MFSAVNTDLNARWVGRSDLIDALLHAVVAGEHVLITGPRGTGKSTLVRDVFSRFTWLDTFYTALNEHTDPDAVLGRTQIPRIKEGDYTRDVKGRLPGSDLAFVDEITRGAQGLLDAFLPIMQERKFDNDGTMQDVPLRTFVAAANHDLSQLGDLPGWFDALDDRFLYQAKVEYVSATEMAKLIGLAVQGTPAISHTVCEEEFTEATNLVKLVAVSQEIQDQLNSLQKMLADQGVVISDRRWMQTVKVLRTSAAIDSRATVDATDLWSLRHVLITTKCEKGDEIRNILRQVSNPYGKLLTEVISVLNVIESAIPNIRTVELDKKTQWATLAQTDLRGAIRQLKSSTLPESQQAPHLQRAEKLRRMIVDDVLGLGLESIQF